MYIDYYEPQSFLAEARTTSASGPPRIFTIYGRKPTIEFFPTPDGNDAIQARGGIYISTFEELPDELQMPATILACCGAMKTTTPEYMATLAMWKIMETKISSTKTWTAWRGSRMPGDTVGFSSGSAGRGADTYNPHGV
jgi:hypothetical protein